MFRAMLTENNQQKKTTHHFHTWRFRARKKKLERNIHITFTSLNYWFESIRKIEFFVCILVVSFFFPIYHPFRCKSYLIKILSLILDLKSKEVSYNEIYIINLTNIFQCFTFCTKTKAKKSKRSKIKVKLRLGFRLPNNYIHKFVIL